MPKKEIIETGKTVDAAIESACVKLGCVREDCEWEIIDLPKKGFLGLKNIPAKVRVSVEIPELQKNTEMPRHEENPVSPPSQPVKPPPRPHIPNPIQSAVNINDAEAARKTENKGTEETGLSVKAVLARTYIEEIISKMGLAAELIIAEENGVICLNIEGKGLGAVIGRRGETLDALQYLASLVANRSDGDYTRVTIDCGDYRTKRRETLEALARKLSAQVKRTNTSRTLEPMNPFERRIIHATVSEIEGVTSISTGEEPNRRVVITTPSARGRTGRGGQRAERNYGESDNYRGNRDFREQRGTRDDDTKQGKGDYSNKPPRGRGSRDFRNGTRRQDTRTQSQTIAGPVNEPPKKTPEAESTDKPLYAKIDLD